MFWSRKKPWYENAVIYQIYPWSFKDWSGDGVGDLEGIISKLDYFGSRAGALNVDALWLSPIYVSPMKDFGYDISNHCDIDPRFGTLETFDRLIAEAHKRGIKIIMDLVTNHTSSEHPWFQEARASKNNPKRDWYVWQNSKADGSAPNNWLSVSGGSAWELDGITGEWYLHQFLKEQPDLNWRNSEVRKEFRKIIEFWLKRGVDGFRVDAANHTIEDDFFRNDMHNVLFRKGIDDPYTSLVHLYDKDRPEEADVINYICESAKHFKDVFIVTESYLDMEGLMKLYKECPYPNHAPFDFNFFEVFKKPWSAESYRTFVTEFDARTKDKYLPTYVLGNHDHRRLMTRFSQMQARLLSLMLLTLRGTVFIYYGEEIGMKNVPIPEEKTKDGFAHQSKDMKISRDPERTPMQWSADTHAGFSTATPWLPVSEDFTTVNVETEKSDPKSMISLYVTLLNLRKSSECLRYGAFTPLPTASPEVFSYERELKKEAWFVMLNFSNATVTEASPCAEALTQVFSTYMDTSVSLQNGSVTLRPYEGILLRKIS